MEIDHSTKNDSSPYCSSCLRSRPTKKLTFRRNIGLLIMRFSGKAEGYLCAECAEYYFWKFSTITLILGWWGFISLLITPVYLLTNLGAYIDSWSLRKGFHGLYRVALEWKLTSSAVVIVVLVLLISPSFPQRTRTSTQPPAPVIASQPTSISVTAVSGSGLQTQASNLPEKTIQPPIQPTPTVSLLATCYHWSDISSRDVNRTRCVYGTVFSSIWEQEVFFLKFDADEDAFRFAFRDGVYYQGLTGQCVVAEGVVKLAGKMRYMEPDEVFSCEGE
jgi:hypothetical protein